MTGEMHKSEVTRENFPIHFAIARALRGTVCPFDHYQGPYVLTPAGRLFLSSDDGKWFGVWNERTGKLSGKFSPYGHNTNRRACRAAREVTAP